MIALDSDISLNLKVPNQRSSRRVRLQSIDYCIFYDNSLEICYAILKNIGVRLDLWTKETSPSYPEAGQFTDLDVENKIKSLLKFDNGVKAVVSEIEKLHEKSIKRM